MAEGNGSNGPDRVSQRPDKQEQSKRPGADIPEAKGESAQPENPSRPRRPRPSQSEQARVEPEQPTEGNPPNLARGRGAASATTSEFAEILAQVRSTPEAARPLAEILSNRYRDAFNDLLDQMEELPQGTEGDAARAILKGQREALSKEFETARIAIAELAPGQERAIDEATNRALSRIEAMPESPEKHQEIQNFIDNYLSINSPEDEALPDRILRIIAKDEATTEKFISRLIVSDLENEPWQIKGFYGNINYEKFDRITREELTPEARDRLKNLRDANSSFHNMNYILKRNFDQFAQQSEAILPQHLEVLASIPGVDEALRFYEERYAAVRARDTRVTEATALAIDQEVEKELKSWAREKNGDGAYTMQGVKGGEMEQWEIFRAYVYSRDFYRIIVRAAEQTTLSELPDQGDPARYVSSPQRRLAEALNILKYTGVRFRIEEQLGGPEILDSTIESSSKKRKERVRIKTLQGTDVDMREFQNIIGARGVFATWRNAATALREMRLVDASVAVPGGKITDITQFFLDHAQEIQGLGIESNKLAKNKQATPAEREALKDRTRELFKPVLDNTSLCLGLLVSPSGLSGATAEFKTLVWEKIADLDPLVTASILTRLETDNPELQLRHGRNAPQIEALEDILLETWGTQEQKQALWGTGGNEKRDTGNIPMEQLSVRELRQRVKKYLDLPDAKKTTEIRREIDAMRIVLAGKEEVLKKVLDSEEWNKLAAKLRKAHRLRMQDETARVSKQQPGETDGQYRKRLEEPMRRMHKTREDALAEGWGEDISEAWGKDRDTDTWSEKEDHYKARRSLALERYLTDEALGEEKLSDKERTVIVAIRRNGREIAGDLARIKQSQAWFLDDVPFRTLNWTALGQFYDRQTGDLGNFSKSAQALLKFISNPYGPKPHEIMEIFGESVSAASAVLGREPAQDNQQPLVETYLEKINEKGVFRQKGVEMIAHAFNHPTSRAQEILGPDAPAVTEDGMGEILKYGLDKGVFRKTVKDAKGNTLWSGSYDALREKFHGMPMDIALAYIRDYGPFAALAFLIKFLQSLGKE